jgi:hypothetical protein
MNNEYNSPSWLTFLDTSIKLLHDPDNEDLRIIRKSLLMRLTAMEYRIYLSSDDHDETWYRKQMEERQQQDKMIFDMARAQMDAQQHVRRQLQSLPNKS